MRRLYSMSIPFYGPIIAKRSKTPSGRLFTAYEPLFRNYVFLFGDEDARYRSLTTNCVSRCVPVPNGEELARELCQFKALINMEVAITPEAQLVSRSTSKNSRWPLQKLRGHDHSSRAEVRLLVAVNFIQRGASILLEDFELEPL